VTGLTKVGQVTEEEKLRIRELFFRREALRLISETITGIKCGTDDWLHERVANDLSAIERLFQAWWDEMSCKYNWPGTQWKVDFSTNDILMIS